jgi:hypothetical protein
MNRGEDDETEEAVFTVRGVIHTKDLPPLRTKPKYVAHELWLDDTYQHPTFPGYQHIDIDSYDKG